jgi:hypothetical protein
MGWELDPAGAILRTGYNQFETAIGISGLAKTVDGELHVLAVVAESPGSGQFRRFVVEAKKRFPSIYFWEDWNPAVAPMLIRYDFVPCDSIESDGERLSGWKWKA